jgi:transposase
MKVTAGSYTRMPDAIWRRMEKLIPKHPPSPKGGRPRLDPRRVADGIYFVMRTGCHWKAVPTQFIPGSSLHRYFQEWCDRGVFRRLWKQGLVEYDQRRGIGWRWMSLDAAMNKAPLGGEKNRAKSHGSRQARCQTIGAYRRTRRCVGVGDRSREPTRHDACAADVRQHSGASSPTKGMASATCVRG